MTDRILYESDELAIERYSSMFLQACVEIRSKKKAGHIAMPSSEWDSLVAALRQHPPLHIAVDKDVYVKPD